MLVFISTPPAYEMLIDVKNSGKSASSAKFDAATGGNFFCVDNGFLLKCNLIRNGHVMSKRPLHDALAIK